MESQVQHALKALCFNTQWKYAVFWKLQHRTRMILTCEDAYYDKDTMSDSQDEFYSSDPLGLAVAKMSYHVYSLGEGIVGQVAITGKHLWITSGDYEMNAGSFFEYCDGLHNQFSAGIKTIAVVSIVPYGIVQLGSLNRITEDLRMVNNIRNILYEIQDSILGPTSENLGGATISSYNNNNPFATSSMDVSYLSPEIFHSAPSNNQNSSHSVPEILNTHLPKDSENSELQYTEALHMPTRFCAGDELYEALGPAFQKQTKPYSLNPELTNTGKVNEIPEEICSSSRENLLEAVIAKVNHTECEIISQKTIDKKPDPCLSDIETISSVGYSFDQSFNSSGAYSVWSSQGVSPASSSKGSELLDRPKEPVKVHKKRARPGESNRPRPRDRQLIQDRIKELRELVPNGSKCSIDSLLERTIKHTLFMQTITKHAEKLNKCSISKMLDKEMSTHDEQGSSWAVEVGSNQKVCPIIVENINMNGQMRVEMLCNECNRFLEVAEAIRSLGLIILKGVTETSGEKTWVRFVVEGQDNRKMHRMDILWSLMQLLQPKS